MKTFSKKPGIEQTQKIECPVCVSRDHKAHWPCDGYSFVQCHSCGLLYQNPQPLHDELIHRYDEEYFKYELDNEVQFHTLMMLGLRDIRFSSITENLLPTAKTFLDIGCATGMLITSLASQGWKVQGVEVCQPSAEYGRKTNNVPIFAGTLEEAGFADNSFNVIHCSHLIEHLTDPLRFLWEVSRLLTDGGFFIVTTPNAAGLQARLFKQRWRSAIADHMFLYSKDTIKRLLSKCGFSALEIKTWGGLAKGTAPGWIKRIFDTLAKPLSFGDVMIVLSQKTEK